MPSALLRLVLPPRSLLALAAGAALLLTGCSGRSCDELPRLRAERDEARQEYLQLARSADASPAETERADAELHALERRVYDIEQGCEGR